MTIKQIAELHVQCSFPVVQNAIATSDTCQHPADSAVVNKKGWRMWRCAAHRGWIDDHTEGSVEEEADTPD